MDLAVIQPRDLVEAGLYRSEEEVIRTALGYLFEARPDLRLELAIHEYQTNEQMSLGGAAELAGVTRWDLMDILVDRGIEPRLGPATIEEAREEAEVARRWFRDHAD